MDGSFQRDTSFLSFSDIDNGIEKARVPISKRRYVVFTGKGHEDLGERLALNQVPLVIFRR